MNTHAHRSPVISVVIPAYNESRYIKRCLQALTSQQTTVPYEIIVVDNTSTDNTAAIAKSFRVRVITEKKKGYGEAARTGVARAHAAIIALTDADTEPNPLWIQNLYRAFTDDPSAVAAGGPFMYYDGPVALRFAVRLVNRINPRILAPTLCGMNMAYRKEAYRAVGGYIPGVNLQADSHLGRRLVRYGRIAYLKDNPVRASARRYATWQTYFRETAIRMVNSAVIWVAGKPLFYTQSDIR